MSAIRFQCHSQQSEIRVTFSVFHTVVDVKFCELFGFVHPNPGKRSTQKIPQKFHAIFHDTFGRVKRRKIHSALLQSSCSDLLGTMRCTSHFYCDAFAKLCALFSRIPKSTETRGLPRSEFSGSQKSLACKGVKRGKGVGEGTGPTTLYWPFNLSPAESNMHTFHCVTTRLPFVSRCFCRSIRPVNGHWNPGLVVTLGESEARPVKSCFRRSLGMLVLLQMRQKN